MLHLKKENTILNNGGNNTWQHAIIRECLGSGT